MDKKATILVVDDEHGIRQSFNMVLKDQFNVLMAENGKEAIHLLTTNSVDVILLDILLPDINGLDLLEKLKAIDPNPEVIMVTAVKEIQTAVRAIKLGAYEYMIKPFLVEDVINIIERALEKKHLVREVAYLKNELQRYHPFQEIIGEDQKMKDIFELISTIAESDGAVLVQGESGTGKELVARAIHNLSPRKNQPFVVISCAAIPSTLMESEVFGYNKGAFTGAVRTTLGKLEIADKGTAFLDDIDTLDVTMQAKLLRVIQEKEFQRLGTTKVIRIDVRFIAASNKDLKELMEKGEFREDLFYRLNVFPIELPPLRERKKDIPLLIDYFLDMNAKKSGKQPKRFSKKAMRILMEYDWPGNVRELQNLVERSFTITKGPVIDVKDIATFDTGKARSKNMTLKEAVNTFEQQYISEVLESVEGNRKEAARILGIHRNTLLSKTAGLGLKKA
ncbi:MAG: sigma-54-dependent Fis family transcriptional regulator [Deltaproteobacteria bacterium]|nr:sigma-54-dependent Fis family transcriptional regulator [Deltaproteobacteria bacterium]MBW2300868.1 sigma-54-dependent Fis family transcriptional regulator [Deltaproteobacteria bacterium]